ncbi:MAG: flagellar biosynthesis protein FlhF [Treponemataceae bacterium]|nr:MAG: flagellar biosynthesis protein FlhF [Treponemataceae bacterium]
MNNQNLQTLRGDSVNDCKSQLREIYGEKNYNILTVSEVYPNGIIARLSGKKQWEVTYQVTPHPRAPLSFDDEREKILNIASKTTSAPYFADLKKQNEALNEKIDALNSTLQEIAQKKDVHPAIQRVEELLEENEFSPSFIKKISEKLTQKLTYSQLDDEMLVHQSVMQWIGEEIAVAPPVPYTKPPRVIALVGPTGVGKTTTIAKLAARYRYPDDPSGYKPTVRMITIDKFRIAAYEQIERYAELMEIQAALAESANDIEEIIKMDEGKLDVLLIDTIGYGPNEYDGIAAMHKVLDVPNINPEIYLAVAASTKASDLYDMLRNYEQFNYKSLVVTKCDETKHLGNIISVLSEKHKTVTYITNGQTVPRNLEEASPRFFLRKLTGFSIKE